MRRGEPAGTRVKAGLEVHRFAGVGLLQGVFGPGFHQFALPSLSSVALKIAYETPDGGPCPVRLAEARGELRASDVLLVQGDVQLALNFGTGSLGVAEEADELAMGLGIESLGDVVHDGACSGARLAPKLDVVSPFAGAAW